MWPGRATGWRRTSTSSTTDDPAEGRSGEGGYLDVGRVARPHGLRGQVVVELVSNRAERSSPGSVFMTDRGELRVTAIRPHGRRFLVTFAGVTSLEAAEELRDVVLRAPPLDDPSVLWVHELVGSEVFDQADGKRLGTVAAVVANPASDLLELDGGGLIPVRCVVDHARGRVVVDIPAGLLE